MSITIEAVYEAGMLKLLAPLPELAERSRVRVTIEPAGKPVPKVRRSTRGVTDHSKLIEWLRQNRDKYRVHWIVLDEDRLIGYTTDPKAVTAIFDQARAEGVRAPFVQFVNEDPEPIWMMWL